ncbi:UV DNA damage repair endonuclease UvsE [Bacillus massilinigeriensis]|uniref:UV DNA damage repair endonuclease UvsE n=1 Tax=Bacillus massilionigeriensis TaxID=1805475 RepID=UPI00096AF0B4|nr:UV DNA damage repair endonuclease UvsE [Bacillus massilionigeriensis]
MTFVRLGYVAMSTHLKNCSPSQTMTYAHFEQLSDREAAIRKLERIALSNLENCLRLLKHNLAHDIHFFRLSSRLIPLATHEELEDWNYMKPLKEKFSEIGEFARKNDVRLDFHPDHFVVLNSPKKEILKTSVHTLQYHLKMLKGMNINPIHRCVLHVGGKYEGKEMALEQFVHNWGYIPTTIQKMIMLENDDKSFDLIDTLYLCEKLGIPFVFDYHHHLANFSEEDWLTYWPRIVQTWSQSPLPIKMHLSSPKSEKRFRDHADYVDLDMFLKFLNGIKGSIPQIDCMIEAKQKDDTLFKLIDELRDHPEIIMIDQSSFHIK